MQSFLTHFLALLGDTSPSARANAAAAARLLPRFDTLLGAAALLVGLCNIAAIVLIIGGGQ